MESHNRPKWRVQRLSKNKITMIRGKYRFEMLVVALLMAIAAMAQPKDKSGGVVSKSIVAITDASQFYQFMKVVPNIGTSARDALAEHSLKSYMMPPRKMNDNSASAWYALAGCLEYYINLNKIIYRQPISSIMFQGLH